MTRPSDFNIEKFPGVDNRRDPYSLPLGTAVQAQNFDIDDSLKLRLRTGLTSRLSGTYHSSWSSPEITYGLARKGSALYKLTRNAGGSLSETSILSGLQTGRPMSYVYLNGSVYFADGVVKGRFDGTTVKNWGLPVPSQPTVAATSGALCAGKYQVVVTHLDDDGVESGAPEGTAVDVPANGGIALTNLPSSRDMNIYVTPANGDVFYLARTVAAGTSSLNLTSGFGNTIPLLTQFFNEPPVGTKLAYVHGRIWIVIGNRLQATKPLFPHLCELDTDFLLFDRTIDDEIAVPNGGLVVSAGQTYWLSTNFAEGEQPERRILAAYEMIPGSGALVDGREIGDGQQGWYAMFATTKGVCLASHNGKFQNISEEHYAYAPGSTGASIVRKLNGFTNAVSLIAPSDNDAKAYVSPEAAASVRANDVA